MISALKRTLLIVQNNYIGLSFLTMALAGISTLGATLGGNGGGNGSGAGAQNAIFAITTIDIAYNVSALMGIYLLFSYLIAPDVTSLKDNQLYLIRRETAKLGWSRAWSLTKNSLLINLASLAGPIAFTLFILYTGMSPTVPLPNDAIEGAGQEAGKMINPAFVNYMIIFVIGGITVSLALSIRLLPMVIVGVGGQNNAMASVAEAWKLTRGRFLASFLSILMPVILVCGGLFHIILFLTAIMGAAIWWQFLGATALIGTGGFLGILAAMIIVHEGRRLYGEAE